jgi:ATP-GRASP peptide maturase of grasp-with-spasm system
MKIIFTEDDDETANIATKWMLFHSIPFIRVNTHDEVDFKALTINNQSSFNLKLINIPEFNSSQSESCSQKIWFRRGLLKITNNILDINSIPNLELNDNVIEALKSHSKSEFDSLAYGIYSLLNKENISTSNPIYYTANKIETLIIAKELGINIPNTIITTSKEELENFCNKNTSVITKGIQEICLIEYKNKTLATYTEEINSDFIKNLSCKFKPTLFQNKIEKKFEIRTFYINGKTYSMAIFSQSDKQTMLDFRRYNLNRPNRVVPYNIPDYLVKKISLLMNKLNINNGSIDLIYSENDEYILLEVNPVGQLGFLSMPNNYNIEEIIALNI